MEKIILYSLKTDIEDWLNEIGQKKEEKVHQIP